MDKRSCRRDANSSDTIPKKPSKAILSQPPASPQQQVKSKIPLNASSSSGSPKNNPDSYQTEIKELKRNQDAELTKDRRTIRKEQNVASKSKRATKKIDDKLHKGEMSRSSSPKTS